MGTDSQPPEVIPPVEKIDTNVDDLNGVLFRNKIPLKIQVVPFKIIKSLGEIQECDVPVPPVDGKPPPIYFLLKTGGIYSSHDNVGYLAIEVSDKCVYIEYRCIMPLYRAGGLGTFLAYLAIYIAIKNNKKYVISFGQMSLTNPQITDSGYLREYNGYKVNKIIVSQYILIKKFGFTDTQKINDSTGESDYTIRQAINEMCEDDAETYLDLHGNLDKYLDFDRKFRNNPREEIFSKYLTLLSKIGKKPGILQQLGNEYFVPEPDFSLDESLKSVGKKKTSKKTSKKTKKKKTSKKTSKKKTSKKTKKKRKYKKRLKNKRSKNLLININSLN